MDKINIKDLYTNVIYNYTPSSHIQKIIQISTSGSGDVYDYIKALEHNDELIKYLQDAANNLTNSKIKHFDHSLALLGLNNVKNSLLGIELARMLDPNLKQLPLFKDAIENTKHAVKAEENAKKISEYYDIAYICGFIFDIFAKRFNSLDLKDLENAELKTSDNIINDVFNNGLKNALIAENLAKNFKISYKRYVFSAALLHNIGKLVLFAYSPKIYDKIVSTTKTNNVNFHQAEVENIDLHHNSLGALYLRQLKYINIIEKSIDFHHDVSLLKHTDIDLYELSTILFIASLIVKHNKTGKDIKDFPINIIEEELIFLNFPKESLFEFIINSKNIKKI